MNHDEGRKRVEMEECANARCWLKFEGNNRIPNHTIFQKKSGRVNFPKRPTGIKRGDQLFIAAVSTDRNGIHVPIVVGSATAIGFDPTNEEDTSRLPSSDWRHRHPYYVEFAEGNFIQAQVKEGISLLKMFKDLRDQIFPSTIGREELTFRDIQNVYSRKSHVRITPKAAQYLRKRLNDLYLSHGLIQIP